MDWCCHLSPLSEQYNGRLKNKNVVWPHCCELATELMLLRLRIRVKLEEILHFQRKDSLLCGKRLLINELQKSRTIVQQGCFSSRRQVRRSCFKKMYFDNIKLTGISLLMGHVETTFSVGHQYRGLRGVIIDYTFTMTCPSWWIITCNADK